MFAVGGKSGLGALAVATTGIDPKRTLLTLREKLIKIGAKVVKRRGYVSFQLAEGAVPRRLFAEILRLIDGLRPKPAPT